MMDQIMMRGDNLGLDPHTTSVMSSLCDQQQAQECRTSKRSRRRRRKKKGARNVPMTEHTLVSAGPEKSPPTTTSTSSPAKFTLSQPVNSSRVRPVDVASTSAAETTTAAFDETSQDTVTSPSALPTTTTQTTAHENRSRIAMKRSFAFLEKHMAHQHNEKPSGKETESHSSFHTPEKASQDKPTEPMIREQPSGKENDASVDDTDELTSFHTPPSTPVKEPQHEHVHPSSVITTDTSLLDNSNSGEDQKSRVIRFADEVGKPLADYCLIGGKDDPHATGRIVIMLLSPQERKFEFIHAEFLRREKTTVAHVLYQVPKIATNVLFQSKTFINLCRTRQGNTDLDNNQILQDYDMEDSELLIGVLEGFTGKEMAQSALPLLLNGRITQAVNQAKKSGRGLKYIVSSEEVEQEREQQREETKQRLHREYFKHRLEESFVRAEKEGDEVHNEEADEFDEDFTRAQREVEEALAKEACNESDESSERGLTEGDGDEEEKEDVEAIKAKLLNIKEHKPSKFLNLKEQTEVSKKAIDDTYPDARDFMGGRDAGLDKVVTFVHALSVAAVGIFMTMSMGN